MNSYLKTMNPIRVPSTSTIDLLNAPAQLSMIEHVLLDVLGNIKTILQPIKANFSTCAFNGSM